MNGPVAGAEGVARTEGVAGAEGVVGPGVVGVSVAVVWVAVVASVGLRLWLRVCGAPVDMVGVVVGGVAVVVSVAVAVVAGVVDVGMVAVVHVAIAPAGVSFSFRLGLSRPFADAKDLVSHVGGGSSRVNSNTLAL